eukprot:CAMPEP_0119139664 /NCGR_PEP_ID=MMETSP1310-20130426/27889_1 /TAXON_ID=464262 /ORGANISM="Genus nov. species nov., Strain RCC2339" /LENGTH=46 /DNA_ID= /DNA_START= /DNA_END= /DNA_ORIENTATION=
MATEQSRKRGVQYGEYSSPGNRYGSLNQDSSICLHVTWDNDGGEEA